MYDTKDLEASLALIKGETADILALVRALLHQAHTEDCEVRLETLADLKDHAEALNQAQYNACEHLKEHLATVNRDSEEFTVEDRIRWLFLKVFNPVEVPEANDLILGKVPCRGTLSGVVLRNPARSVSMTGKMTSPSRPVSSVRGVTFPFMVKPYDKPSYHISYALFEPAHQGMDQPRGISPGRSQRY